MKNINSLGNRIIALALCFVMVLGMFPSGAAAVEDTTVYASVESLTDGITITGSGETITATYAGTLNWVAKNESVGRFYDGWWAGIKVTAPATLDLEKAQYTSGGTAKSFKQFKDSADDAEVHYITMWGLINEVYLREANLTDGKAVYTYTFDWDGDGVFEQTVELVFDAARITLVNELGTTVYPAAQIGFGSLSMLTAGATISGNDTAGITVTYDQDTTVDWVAADPSVGRYQDGWWAGMKITVPAGMTEEQVRNAQYMSGDKIKSFWDYKDSKEGDAVHFLTMWIPLNGLLSNTMAPYIYKFDWNNDGLFEQRVEMSVDASKITLTRNGAQVFPVLGQVTSYVGGSIEGSGTSIVKVLIDDVVLNWSEANPAIGRVQGWWVGIKVESPVGMTAPELEAAVYQVKSGPNDDWSADKSFWSNKDSKDGDAVHNIQLWMRVTPESLEKFKSEGRNITLWYRFDWDHDGEFDQEITFSVDPNGSIVLNKADQTGFGFAVENPDDIWVGDGTYTNVASGGQSGGAVTYEIVEGADIATVDENGKVTFTAAGSATVRATLAGDTEGYYNAATAQYTITAVKKTQEPKFQNSEPGAITYAPNYVFENQVTNVQGGTVKYEILESEPAGEQVATINAATGALTILRTGTVTVKATISGDWRYHEAEVRYELEIQKANQPDVAFKDPPAELTWQSGPVETLELINVLNGKDGKIEWTIIKGTDVATVDENGKITLLKAGTFTIQALCTGDHNYNASQAITATIVVNPAEQQGFGFGNTERITVTYNDNDNKLELPAVGGQSEKAVEYTIIPADAASADAVAVDENGNVTILKAGTVTIKATKPADDRYKAADDSYVLTINPAAQTFVFNSGAQIDLYYGTLEYTNAAVFGGKVSDKTPLTYSLAENDIGAQIDPVSGKITFADSAAKVGQLTVTATKPGDECYSAFTSTYTVNVSYLPTVSQPEVSGDKMNDSEWYTGNVAINAPEGYTISTGNGLTTAEWSDKLSFTEIGADQTATVYLKNADGFITDAISVEGIYFDPYNPEDLQITYAEPEWQVALERLTFGLYQSDKLEVTVSAKDANSGVATMVYNIGGEDVTVNAEGVASVSKTFTIDGAYRDDITMTVTDVAGLQTKLENGIVVVLDQKNPDLTAEYEYASEQHREDQGIYYTQKDATVNFVIDEANFDLSGLEILNTDGQKTQIPVVEINGTEQSVTWTRVEGTTQWKGSVTLSGNGDYVVEVNYTDPANNKMDPYIQEIHIDDTQPVIAVNYDNNEFINDNHFKAARTPEVKITAHNFKPQDVELTVIAKDITGKNVDLSTKNYESYVKDPANWSRTGDVWALNTEGMVFDIDANYAVSLMYTDLNGNKAEAYAAEFVIDKQGVQDVTIDYSTSIVDKVLEAVTFGFYQPAVMVTVSVKDITSGVDFFEFTYTQEDGKNTTNKESYKTEKLEPVQDPNNKDVFTATHIIKAEARGKVSVDVTDKAGNLVTKTDDKVLVVDNIAPGLDVEYIFTNDQKREYNNIYYTQGETTVRFTMDEANFDLTLLTAEDETTNQAPKATVNGVAQDLNWTQLEGTNKWVSEITLTDNGDYVVALTFADRSGNKMELRSETTGARTSDEEKTFSKEIHIDNVRPAFDISYDNNDARNGNMYKADRTATIKITEHNFNPAEVALTVTAKDITGAEVDLASKAYTDYAKNPKNWINAGDEWTLRTSGTKFDIDGIYAVELAYTDLAENVADVYTTDFVIDKTPADGIEIVYEDEVENRVWEALAAVFYKEEATVKIKAEDMTAGVEYFEITYTKEDGSSVTNRETFTTQDVQVNQDAASKNIFTATYKIPAAARGTVSVRVMDMAGNESTADNTTLMVVDQVDPTREVLYTPYKILDRATMTEVDEYHEGDDAILYFKDKCEVTFKITEANFDLSLKNEADKPVIKINGIAVDVKWDRLSGEDQNGDVWVAKYTITDDGDYEVSMTYKDLSTNQMVSYKSCRLAIDSTAPVVGVTYTDGKPAQTIDGTRFYGTTQTALIQITDHNFRADDVVLTVTAKDVQGNPVEVPDYAAYAKDRANWTSEGDVHTLNTAGMVFNTDARYTFDIAYDDICDNPAKDYTQDSFVVDHAAPTGPQISYSTPVYQTVLSALTFGFYKPSVTVTLRADDVTAGVDYFEWTYMKQRGTSDVNTEKSSGKLAAGDITYTNGGKTATASFTIPANARGSISASVTDRAGNKAEKFDNNIVSVVDNIAPTITVTYEAVKEDTKVQFVDAARATVGSFEQAANAFYNGDVKATITINEANFLEGAKASDGVIHQVGIKLTKTYDDGTQSVVEYLPAGAAQLYADAKAETVTWKTEGDVHTFVIPYSDNADYVLELEYTDLSTNEAQIAANDGKSVKKSYVSKIVTVDKIAPVIQVAYGNETVINTIDERKYFDKTQSAVITVTEHNFRAADVQAVVNAVNFLDGKVQVADFAAQLADEKNWTHNGNVHTAKVDYMVDANYTFDIDLVDLAQNASADYKLDQFTVDTAAPTNLKVSYSTNVFQEILESITFGYYNAQMTVKITADDVTSGIHHFAYSYIKGANVSGVNAELLNQALEAAQIEHDGITGMATFSIPKMVLGNDNQFNGTVSFTAYDRSENNTELKDTTRIVVDNIRPNATITYNSPIQNHNGISYYDGNIQANIVINEANFDAGDVMVSVTKDGVRYPVSVSWRDNSVDTHTGSFVLSADGDYIVSVQYRDKSGNQMASYTSNQLTLDTTAPTIKVSNIKANSANKDEEYGFVIEFNDINLDASSLKPVLQAVKQNEAGVYEVVEIDLGNAATVVSGQTYTYTVTNLPDDGLYTLTCEVKDMSGNVTSEVQLDDGQTYGRTQFSINRKGSVFAYGADTTEALVKQYYVYSVEEDVVLVEVNVDPVENYKVTLNGKELTEGTDYTTEQTSNDGEWSKRTYVINKDLFAEEGEYSIIVSSTDKANTTVFSDVKNLGVAFVVDQTKPVLTISGLEASGRYQTDEQIVTLIPTDEGGRLNSLSVVVLNSSGDPLTDDSNNDISLRFEMSGEELLKHLEENDGKITFTIPEGLNNQVRIICNDCAVNAENQTNEYNELFKNVTVSQNKFVIFYADTKLFYGSIAGSLSLIALIIFLIKRKKDKKAAK